jgi:quinol monooxygenase YgiN
MVKVVARNYIKEGKLEEFKAIAKVLVEETNKKDAGCISYALCQDIMNPQVLAMVEEWESPEALDNHMKAKHFLDNIPKLGALCEKEADISLYNKLF